MKGVLGLISLLLALLVVGMLVKKQMTAVVPAAAVVVPGAEPLKLDPNQSLQAQKTQIEQQVKDAMAAAQKARPMPD